MENKKRSGRKTVLLIGGIILLVTAAARLITGRWIGGPADDFIGAALPWVSMVVGIACFAAGWTEDSNK